MTDGARLAVPWSPMAGLGLMDGDSQLSVGVHEDLFIARYAMLRRWARRVVGRDRSQADDLVQAAFLRFVQRRPRLTRITNLDTYLFSLVRNLRRDQVRRPAVQFEESFAPLDDQDAVAGVEASAGADRLDARDALLTICEYAILRKETSKAGSVLLLRFLWGYYPAEIARLARTSASAVNQWLRIARREIREYLDNPPASTCRTLEAWREAVRATARRERADDLARDLRAALACTCQTPCPSPDWYYALYARLDSDTVDCETLAHLASCGTCQQLVATHLGLRTPDDPTNRLGRNNGSGDGALPGTGSERAKRSSTHARRSRAKVGRAALRSAGAASQRLLEGLSGWLAAARVPIARLAIAAGAVLATLTLWHVMDRPADRASAASVLRDVRAAESAVALSRDLATHRTVVVEHRRLPQRQVMMRQRVELWQSAAHGVRARRVYDAQQRLVAGEWTLPNGTQRIYTLHAAPRSEPTRTAHGLSAETAWRWEPSAIAFSALGLPIEHTTVDDRVDTYVLRFTAPASHVGDGVIEATLTITKRERRAIEQRVVVREAMTLHEYHFREVGYDRLPAREAPAGVFEPEPELLGPTASPVVPPAAPARSVPAADARLDAAEVSAIFGLHRLESCLVQVPHVARGSSQLRIEAIVRDATCADQARRLFAELDPSVVDMTLDIRSPGTVGRVAEPWAASSTLAERAMGRDGSAPGPVVREVAVARAHAHAVYGLVRSWPTDRLQRIDLTARLEWQAMIRDHAWHVRQEADRLVVRLAQRGGLGGAAIFPGSGGPGSLTIRDLGDVRPAADELVRALGDVTRTLRRDDRPHGRADEDTRAAIDALQRLSSLAGAFLEVWALNVTPNAQPD